MQRVKQFSQCSARVYACIKFWVWHVNVVRLEHYIAHYALQVLTIALPSNRTIENYIAYQCRTDTKKKKVTVRLEYFDEFALTQLKLRTSNRDGHARSMIEGLAIVKCVETDHRLLSVKDNLTGDYRWKSMSTNLIEYSFSCVHRTLMKASCALRNEKLNVCH